MIDSKDLREGIWVRSIHTGPVQVSLFMIGEIADDETYLDHLMPIPLSPEVLKACGFESSKEGTNFTYDLGGLSIHFPSRSYPDGRTYFNSWRIIEGVPESLHHLMNLYYALTNQEINYKP